jgi:dTDP-4-dehydrorhamnose reductase
LILTNGKSAEKIVLVFGVSGFLGSNLAILLREMDGYQVIGVSRVIKPIWFDSVYHQETDYSIESLRGIINQFMPTVIVNCLALSDHEKCEANPQLAEYVNTQLAISLAHLAQEVGSKFVQISTDSVFSGQNKSALYRECDPPKPFSTYGKTKLEGETGVLAVASNSIVSRVNFFGWSPDGKRSILEFFLKELLAGNQITGYKDFIVTSEYVNHLCIDLIDLIELDFSGIIHLSSSDAVSKYDFGVLVADIFQLDPSLIKPATGRTPSSEVIVSRSRDLALDSSLASKILGRQRPSQKSGIKAAKLDTQSSMQKFSNQTDDWRTKI